MEEGIEIPDQVAPKHQLAIGQMTKIVVDVLVCAHGSVLPLTLFLNQYFLSLSDEKFATLLHQVAGVSTFKLVTQKTTWGFAVGTQAVHRSAMQGN